MKARPHGCVVCGNVCLPERFSESARRRHHHLGRRRSPVVDFHDGNSLGGPLVLVEYPCHAPLECRVERQLVVGSFKPPRVNFTEKAAQAVESLATSKSKASSRAASAVSLERPAVDHALEYHELSPLPGTFPEMLQVALELLVESTSEHGLHAPAAAGQEKYHHL